MEKEKKKMGRPTDNPRNERLTLRLSKSELEILNECSELTGKSRTDIIIKGIKEVYSTLKK